MEQGHGPCCHRTQRWYCGQSGSGTNLGPDPPVSFSVCGGETTTGLPWGTSVCHWLRMSTMAVQCSAGDE
ncbi:hypothetical protein GBAR_LOCUS31005, partial [Geodia barretti]